MNKSVFATACLALILVAYFSIKHTTKTSLSSTAQNKAPLFTEAESPNNNGMAVKVQTQKKDEPPESTAAQIDSQADEDSQWFSDIEIYEIYQWMQSQGLFFTDKELYQSYNLSTLEQLAEQGDEIALYLLPGRYSKMHYESRGANKQVLAKKDEALRNAAIYGSSYAIERIAGELIRQASQDLGGPPEIRRDMMKEGFAYLMVAERRGWGMATVERNRLESEIQAPWTKEEQLEIEAMAQAAYQEFEDEREKLGLEPFDNSVPQLVKKYYNAIIERKK